MTTEHQALSTLVRGLSADSLDLNIHNLLQESISMGSISNAEMIAYTGLKEKKVSEENYYALMFAFEKCDDVI